MTKRSVLTDAGEQFLADILQAYRDGGEDYYKSDLCEEWGLEYVVGGNIRIPDEYGDYGAITKTDVPLLLKSRFLRSTEIRTYDRDTYPSFHNEVFGEICLWKEAQRRGEPHTDLFAPVFHYDTSNFKWAVVAYATNIQHRGRPASKRVEERGRELGWAPDDIEVGLFEGRYVAVDYGLWWRQNDEWITDVNERPYIDSSSYDDRAETQISDNVIIHELDDTHSTHCDDASSASQGADVSESQKTRFYRWLSALFS